MPGIIIITLFILAGVLTGMNVLVPYSYSQYIAVAILACLDSVFGALNATLNKKFKMNIFLTGFFGNSLIAMFLVFIGTKLNVDIYLGAVIVFTGRLLSNFTAIRRQFIDKVDSNEYNIKDEVKKAVKNKKKTKKVVKKNENVEE